MHYDRGALGLQKVRPYSRPAGPGPGHMDEIIILTPQKMDFLKEKKFFVTDLGVTPVEDKKKIKGPGGSPEAVEYV